MPYTRITDVERLHNLLDAVLLIGSDLSLPAVLQRIVDCSRTLVGARYAALSVLDEQKYTIDEFLTSGMDAETIQAIGHLPEGLGVLGLLVVDPHPIRLREIGRHPDSHGFPPNHPPMHSFLGVPVHVRGQVFGNLYLTEKMDADEFTADDESLVTALALSAGVAIENARLHARVSELVLVEDHERIARDLHDTVIQRLFAIGLALQGTSRLVISPDVQKRIQDSVDDLDTTIRQIRSTIFALEQDEADRRGLRSGVLAVAKEVSEPLGRDPRIRFSGPIDTEVDPAVADHLLATLREALTNVVRHAEAHSVEIAIDLVGGMVTLRVTDDGIGLNSHHSAEGHGLRNMRNRAEALGGTFSTEVPPGGGTTLIWRAPARIEEEETEGRA